MNCLWHVKWFSQRIICQQIGNEDPIRSGIIYFVIADVFLILALILYLNMRKMVRLEYSDIFNTFCIIRGAANVLERRSCAYILISCYSWIFICSMLNKATILPGIIYEHRKRLIRVLFICPRLITVTW